MKKIYPYEYIVPGTFAREEGRYRHITVIGTPINAYHPEGKKEGKLSYFNSMNEESYFFNFSKEFYQDFASQLANTIAIPFDFYPRLKQISKGLSCSFLPYRKEEYQLFALDDLKYIYKSSLLPREDLRSIDNITFNSGGRRIKLKKFLEDENLELSQIISDVKGIIDILEPKKLNIKI